MLFMELNYFLIAKIIGKLKTELNEKLANS